MDAKTRRTGVFPVTLYEVCVREFPSGGTPTIRDKGIGVEFPEADPAVDAVLAQYDSNAASWSFELANTFAGRAFPWAVILFDREYNLAGHFRLARGDRSEFPFGCFTVSRAKPSPTGMPLLGCAFALTRQAFQRAATKTEILRSAAELLTHTPETGHWLCLPRPLPQEWTTEAEAEDFAIFWRLEGFEAVQRADVPRVEEVIRRWPGFVTSRGENDWTPLHLVAAQGVDTAPEHARIAELLLDRGADPNAKCLAEYAPLHCLAVNGSAESVCVAEILLSRGADPHALGPRGMVPARLCQHGAEVRDVLFAAMKKSRQ